jgi:leucyl aminopeptidase
VALVGKGVTFDSGGLSLKSAEGMQDMRIDMAGAAGVLGVVAALARSGDSSRVVAVLPLVENLPGPTAVKPGDVVTAWNGTRIQIMDSDFEGRVILSDGLAFSSRAQPKVVVSIATLTYQARIALGDDITALLARDQEAGDRLLAAAERTGDPLWPLPWAERYRSQIRLSDTTVRNHPLAPAGRAITAALFLGEFVPTGVPYLHLDIGATAWTGDTSTGHATGAMISALAAFAAEA